MTRIRFLTLAFALLALATPALGQTQVTATLRGYEEVPAISTTGTGSFNAVIDDASETIKFQLRYQNTAGNVTAAHIHFGQRSVNGGIVAFLCGGGGQPACPASPGLVTGMITPANVQAVGSQGIAAGEWDEIVAAIRAGVGYANVHTDQHGAGEIRGQIRLVTPPPAGN
jgi:hypothetical protein